MTFLAMWDKVGTVYLFYLNIAKYIRENCCETCYAKFLSHNQCFLITGKKKDSWFILDPKTGQRNQVAGWSKTSPTCPIKNKNAIYVGRTKYSVMMVDTKNPQRKWNITFYDYRASPMSKEEINKYG